MNVAHALKWAKGKEGGPRSSWRMALGADEGRTGCSWGSSREDCSGQRTREGVRWWIMHQEERKF